MSKTKAQKVSIAKDMAENIKTAKAVVFADYQGLTMTQLSQLRNTLETQDAKFTITKNSLLSFALKDAGLTTTGNELESGPTATLLAYQDEITPIKTLVKALKDAQIGSIKAGFMGSEYFNGSIITKLSELPSKQELRAQVVRLVVSPLRGMVTVLQGNLKNLVYALDQIRVQKSETN